ncbi:MAG: DUF2924 domain-containing protein [Terricaulis sp.]|nr:DUF2924 domain-containing protein [Terricaulis sp.]
MIAPDLAYQRLAALKLNALRQAWATEFIEIAPPFASRELLMHAFIHKLEVAHDRDLKPWAKKRLTELTRQFTEDPNRAIAPRAPPSIGSALVREWNGVRHVVLVTADGFQYGERAFASLTQVAKAITGQHRSGPLFFDLHRLDRRSLR